MQGQGLLSGARRCIIIWFIAAAVNGVKPDIFDIWTKAAVQSATALAVDYVAMAIDWKFQSIDYFSHWVKDMHKFIFFLLIVVTFGGIRRATRLCHHWCKYLRTGQHFFMALCCGSFEISADALVCVLRLCMELLLLFCPSYTKETGVLLEYCDVPSLFAGIGS